MATSKTHTEAGTDKAPSEPVADKLQQAPEIAKAAGPVTRGMAPPPTANSAPANQAGDIATFSSARTPCAQLAVRLQRSVGNVRLGSMLRDGLQTKIAVGKPGDRYEQEADEVASRVVSGHRVARISRIASGGASALVNSQARDEKEPRKRQVQRQLGEEEEPWTEAAQDVQAKVEPGGEDAIDDAGAEARIKNPGGGHPLPDGIRSDMEAGLGADFSGVLIHDTEPDRAEAGRLNAKAFAYRDHIWLGPGASAGDRKLMAHELTHVVQQGGGGSRLGREAESHPITARSSGHLIMPETPEGTPTPETTHEVVSGDTLGQIAERYGVTTEAIREANGLTGDTIRIGQILVIPQAAGAGAPTPETTHEVVSGDTLGQIAERYGVTTEAIREANGLTGDTIRIGQVLVIPQAAGAGTPAPETTHEVVSGDTLGGIAERYGVTAEAIREANGLTGDTIRIGQVLVIPQAAATTPTPAPTLQPGVPANFSVTTVAGVRSQAMHEYAGRQLSNNWDTLRRRFRQRNEIISQVVGLGWARAGDEQTALTNLQARWTALSASLGDSSFDPAFGTIPSDANFDAAIQAERNDQAVFSRRVFGNMNRVIEQFLTALANYRASRRRLDEEATEYHRMDALFANPDLMTLIAAIPHATFNAAEIKSMVSQESGDLTNTTIAGLTGKTRGLIDTTPNPGTFVGVGQHSTGARNEAIAWAASKGVTIPATPDPRTIPQESIKLSAAYLGRVVEDLLYPNLPAVKATGVELKKMAFAGYNGGARNVSEAANAFVAGRSGINYTWDDIKNDGRISGQMRNYVEEIVWRLS